MNCSAILDLKYEPHVCKNCIMEYLKESEIQRQPEHAETGNRE